MAPGPYYRLRDSASGGRARYRSAYTLGFSQVLYHLSYSSVEIFWCARLVLDGWYGM